MMRAIVLTASSGYLPTDVSPESITASAPSSTALATSDASARVGREFSIIDSSIWVATMTGLAFSLAIWMARFCTSGTSSSGSSTPRSPRATMIASNASTIASRLSIASGFSSLAITGTRLPTRSITSCTSSMSAGERTNDSATRSTPRPQRELEILDVLLRQRRHRHVHARQRHALVVADRSALGDRADHVVAVDLLDDQTDVSVVDENPVARRRHPRPAACRSSTPDRGCPRSRRP